MNYPTLLSRRCGFVPIPPAARSEYELPDAIDLCIQSGRTIDASLLDGWRSCKFVSGTSDDCVIRRIDVGYPEDRDRAAERLDEEATEIEAGDNVDEATVDS